MYPWHDEGNRIFRGILIVQLLIAVVIGLITGQLAIAFLLGIPIITLPLVLSFIKPGRFITQITQALATQLMTALHIHQAFGQIEMHFEIFVLLAFLAYPRLAGDRLGDSAGCRASHWLLCTAKRRRARVCV